MDLIDEVVAGAFKEIWRTYTHPLDTETMRELDAAVGVSEPVMTFDEHWERYGVPALKEVLNGSPSLSDEQATPAGSSDRGDTERFHRDS